MATALTAAVRTAVTADASRIAVGTPIAPSNSVTVPWWESSPRAGLPGITHSDLSANTGSSPPRHAGISPMNPGASANLTTERSGMCASPRACAASTSAIASAHSSGGSASITSSWLRIRTELN